MIFYITACPTNSGSAAQLGSPGFVGILLDFPLCIIKTEDRPGIDIMVIKKYVDDLCARENTTLPLLDMLLMGNENGDSIHTKEYRIPIITGQIFRAFTHPARCLWSYTLSWGHSRAVTSSSPPLSVIRKLQRLPPYWFPSCQCRPHKPGFILIWIPRSTMADQRSSRLWLSYV